MSTLRNDFAYSWRSLRRRPVFAAMAVLTLGLGIGIHTTALSLVDGLLLRPPSLPEAERLVQVSLAYPNGRPLGPFTLDEYERLAALGGPLELVVARTYRPRVVGRGGAASRYQGELVSRGYFELAGLQPVAGRFFDRNETDAVVVSERLANALGVEPGRVLDVDGETRRVIGVVSRTFRGLLPLVDVDVWEPLDGRDAGVRGARDLGVVARLAPGVDLDGARSALHGWSASASKRPSSEQHLVRLERFAGVGVPAAFRAGAFRWTAILIVLVSLVLAVACANVASLLLARGVARTEEISTRVALGASRWRLVRLLMMESVQLAAAGGVVGLLLATVATRLVGGPARIPAYLGFHLDVTPDLRVFAMAAGVAFSTSLLFGLAPALVATRPSLFEALRQPGGDAIGARRLPLHQLLVALQVAVSTVLLVVAGLLLRSAVARIQLDPGFEPRDVVALDLVRSEPGGSFEAYRRLESRVLAVRGVLGTAWADRLPLEYGTRTRTVQTDPSSTGTAAAVASVSPGYFRLLGVAQLSGRDFRSDDSAGTAIVDQALAARLWTDGGAVGRSLYLAGESRPRRVVGVVGNVRQLAFGADRQPAVYRPLRSELDREPFLLVRTVGGAGAAESVVELRRILGDEGGELALAEVIPLSRQVATAAAPAVQMAQMFGAVAGAALLLTACGVLGVMSWSVGRRRREIGIRIALGGRSTEVVGLLLRDSLGLALCGLGLGWLASLFGGKILSAYLFGIGPRDPITYTLVPVVIVVMVAVAAFLPVRSAVGTLPARELRSE